MKKNLLLLPVLLATTFLTAFARPEPGNEKQAEQNFTKQFAGAENVSWSKAIEGHLKVTFTWGGHRTEAYFNQQAEFVGAIRGIFYDQLPLTVIRGIEKAFPKPLVLEVREISTVEGTSYALVIEKKKGKYKVLVGSDGTTSLPEKLR